LPLYNGAAAVRRHLLFCVLCIVELAFPSFAQPTNPQADPVFRQKYSEGRTALEAGKNKDALEAFKQAASLANGNCAECYLGMAVVYIRTQMLPEVLASCDKALSYATDNSIRATALVLEGQGADVHFSCR
jgi:tetratricopeptide (TPR) repeat protein